MPQPAHARVNFAVPGAPADGWIFPAFDRVLETRDLAAVPALIAELAAWQAAGGWAVGLLSYEAAPAFDPALQVRPPAPDGPPLLWFGLSRQGPVAGPPPPAAAPAYSLPPLQPAMDPLTYADAFAAIQRRLFDGETYQVNYTFPMDGRFTGDVAALYADLRRAQLAPYCAWLHSPHWDVLSVSPELFFETDGPAIRTRPMKGTRRRGPDTATDAALRDELAGSTKERAENVMIVDLLRNDLGRICSLGSVHAERICQVERYPTVWQLTSTVSGRLRPDADLAAVLRALFPCGSVTGAPKVRTMQIIAAAETAPRGVYCGAIGLLQPHGRCTFNVAIRTLTLLPDGRARFPVGSGLVVDGEAPTEYAECLAKARVLQALDRPADVLLRETCRWDPGDGYLRLDRHLDRLADGALYFGYACDPAAVRAALAAACRAWTVPQRVALSLARDGTPTVEAVPFDGTPAHWRLRLHPVPVDSQDPFLRHKTTHRAVYTAAYAARGDADDVILQNERGELTELTRANLALQLDGRWYTPPVAAGLLPGCLRAELLAAGSLAERTLTPADLRRATAILALNSLRGAWPATVVE